MERFPLVRFYGTVYLPTEKPASGARVIAAGVDPAPSHGVYIADSVGRYTTDPLPSYPSEQQGTKRYSFYFLVRHGDFAITKDVELEKPPKEVREDFWLAEGLSISGFVRDPKGNAVEGATVFPVKQFSKAKQGEETLSAADGSFILRGFPQGYWAHTLRAEKVVVAGGQRLIYAGEAFIGMLRTPIRAPKLGDIEIVVARIGNVSGRTLYHDGRPVRNAEVFFMIVGEKDETEWRPRREIQRSVVLNDEGEFEIAMPCVYQRLNLIWRDMGREEWRKPERISPDAGTWDIVVRKSGGSQGGVIEADSVVFVRGVEAGTSNLEIRFPPLGSITGRVVYAETGEPVERFDVGMWSQDNNVPGPDWVFSGSQEDLVFPDGRFRVEALVPRTYSLSVEKKVIILTGSPNSLSTGVKHRTSAR